MASLTLSALDEKLLRLADHNSPDEISRHLGGAISPARAAARIKELLKTRDWLSAAEQDEIVTWKMRQLLGSLEEAYFKGDLASAKIQLDFLKAIGDRLDKRRAATEDEKNALYMNQATIVFQAIKAMIDVAKLDSEARAALREALPEAVYVLQARNVGQEIEE